MTTVEFSAIGFPGTYSKDACPLVLPEGTTNAGLEIDDRLTKIRKPGIAGRMWDYRQAFNRNLGLVSESGQEKLRNSRVAIVGMGGVGGVHLITLARLGVGKFTIADPDRFELANTNRQYGARTSSFGRSKAEVMAEEALAINPGLDIRVMPEAIDTGNVDRFLDGADLFVDGIDFFAVEARRMLFGKARERGIWGVTAGPIGYGTAWLSFDPRGMSFDTYFDMRDGMDRHDQLIAFAVGLAPSGIHVKYMDLKRVNLDARTGPSLSLACQLCSGVAGAEVVKILTGRGVVKAAPYYGQFDMFTSQLRTGRLRWGNRNPIQRIKRKVLKRLLTPVGSGDPTHENK